MRRDSKLKSSIRSMHKCRKYSGGRKSCLVPVLYYSTFSNESRCVFALWGVILEVTYAIPFPSLYRRHFWQILTIANTM